MSDSAAETRSLLLFAMDHAIELVRAANGPLVPFVAADIDGQEELHRFVGETLEESLAHATRYVMTECRGIRSVLVYDGYLTAGETRSDAIYAESVDEQGNVTVVAQRYRPRSLLRSFEAIGNPVQLAVKGLL